MNRGGQQFGPFTLDQLREFARDGRLLPGDAVWQPGEPSWTPAGQRTDLFAFPAASPAPAPVAMPLPAPASSSVPGAPPLPRVGAWFHVTRALKWNLRRVVVTDAERQFLISLSVDEEDARRYLVWRHSVLLMIIAPTLLSAILATIGAFTADTTAWSGFGYFSEMLRVLSLYALPIAAFTAARAWHRHRRSRRRVLVGFLIAFLTPLLLALFPIQWRFEMDMEDSDVRQMQEAAIGLVGAIAYYVALMPAVLSLLPGILRACLRVKALLPESILPGWFLVAASPLYMLLFLVVFVTVNQLAGNALLVLGVLALTGAPMLYLANASVFVRPLSSDPDVARFGRVQKGVFAILFTGVLFLLIYAFTAEVFGRSLLGVDADASLLRPWDPEVLRFPVEYLSRSLFVTVLVADLFMLMNLSVWRHTKTFVSTPRAGEYDRLMSEIEEAGGRA